MCNVSSVLVFLLSTLFHATLIDASWNWLASLVCCTCFASILPRSQQCPPRPMTFSFLQYTDSHHSSRTCIQCCLVRDTDILQKTTTDRANMGKPSRSMGRSHHELLPPLSNFSHWPPWSYCPWWFQAVWEHATKTWVLARPNLGGVMVSLTVPDVVGRLSFETLQEIIDDMVQKGNAEWEGGPKGAKSQAVIYWRKPDDWANLIWTWVCYASHFLFHAFLSLTHSLTHIHVVYIGKPVRYEQRHLDLAWNCPWGFGRGST